MSCSTVACILESKRFAWSYFDTSFEKAIWGRGISLITGLFSLPIMINFSLHFMNVYYLG